jgi:hypothetical protein
MFRVRLNYNFFTDDGLCFLFIGKNEDTKKGGIHCELLLFLMFWLSYSTASYTYVFTYNQESNNV